MVGQRHFSSPGIRFKTTAAILAIVQRLFSYSITLAADFSSCGWTTPLGCCTCWGPLRWWAVKAREWSYWPWNLIFAGVINQIILLTFAGEFSNLLLLLTRAFSNKKWQIITFSYEKVKNHYFFLFKIEKSLLFVLKVENDYFFILKSDKSLLIRKVK